MGSAINYICAACGEHAEDVCEEGDCGMDLAVVTPVVCREHGIVWGETGLTWDGEDAVLDEAYPCPECGAFSPRWDGITCPKCGEQAMAPDPEGPVIMWD